MKKALVLLLLVLFAAGLGAEVVKFKADTVYSLKINYGKDAGSTAFVYLLGKTAAGERIAFYINFIDLNKGKNFQFGSYVYFDDQRCTSVEQMMEHGRAGWYQVDSALGPVPLETYFAGTNMAPFQEEMQFLKKEGVVKVCKLLTGDELRRIAPLSEEKLKAKEGK